MSAELTAMLELLGMLLLSPRTGVLILLLGIAAVSDARTGRIPNWLVFGGAIYAIVYNAIFPIYVHDIGIVVALGGLAVGLCALLPLYAFRVMGAGDVKLMAMTGAFLGAATAWKVVLATLVVGGVMAVVLALWSGQLPRMLRNVAMMFRGTLLTFSTGVGGIMVHDGASAGRMPYGVAIAAGSVGYLLATQLALI